MEVSKSKNRNSRKCYKKYSKFINYIQKHPVPKNYNPSTEKIFHQRIRIADLQTEKYPTLIQGNPDSCKYIIVKRRIAVKQRKLRNNGERISNSQEQTRRSKQTNLNNLLIMPSCYALEMDRFNKILKRKCSFEKKEERYKPFQNPVAVAKNKLIDAKSFKPENLTNKSKENVCLMNNKLNSKNTLLFQCSADSLQLEQSKMKENINSNLRKDFSLKQAGENKAKKVYYNNINGILPKMMQQVTVYNLFENLKDQPYLDISEDNMYSSISTCSSVSSTREYYLPAVSSSTDTMHVADVLANRKMVELTNPQKDTIPKQQQSNQDIYKNSQNKNKSNLSPLYQQTPLENGILSFSNIEMKEVELDRLKKSKHQIINMLKDNNEALLPFFPFTDFNSLLIKNKSMFIKNCEKSNIGVQTQDDDESIINETIMNKKIKLSKGNFIINNNTNNNESLHISMESNKKKPLKSFSSVTTQNFENSKNNVNKVDKEEIGILSKHLNNDYLHDNEKEKVNTYYNGSKSTLPRTTNKSISEDMFATIMENGNKIYQSKTAIQKAKSSMSISDKKSKSPELPLYYKSYPNDSNDSINASKPYFVKLNPFFDAGFKDPKISRLLLSSKTLAGESDSALDKVKIHSDLVDSHAERFAENESKGKKVKSATMSGISIKGSALDKAKIHSDLIESHAERFTENESKEKYVKSATMSAMAIRGSALDKAKIHSDFIDNQTERFAENERKEKYVKSAIMPAMAIRSSINKENKIEVKHSCDGSKSIFTTDSIIYGSNAFQKIRKKFDLMKSKRQINKKNIQFQERESLNKQRVIIPNRSWDESYQGLDNNKNNTQSIDCKNSIHNNMNIATLSDKFLMNENPKNVNMVSSENEGFSENRKYILLLPKNSDRSNHQLEHYVKEPSHINKKEKIIDFSSIHYKTVDNRIVNNGHELINIDLKSCSSKRLKLPSDLNEIKNLEQRTIDTKYLLEKQTQVNMYLVETSKKEIGDTISNETQMTEIEEMSTAVSDKVGQSAMMNNSLQVEAAFNNSRTENILNNYEQTKANSIGQAEATIMNNYGQPVILYNNSGYPITDFNGRVLKNNLGSYLLNTDKYADVITEQLPVFDCDLISVSNSGFNPTKVPFCEIQLKITDRCGNPVALFNNLGWPLTNEDGFFLHDNQGKLLVEMDSFNFPLCCSNGSPIYLKNGAMLLSQKFKFIVTKVGSDIKFNIRSFNIEKRSENEVNSNYSKEYNQFDCTKPVNYIENMQVLNESYPKNIKSPNFQTLKQKKPDLRYNLFFPTEVPELMHELFNNTATRFSNFRSDGGIPQSPIPIFDRSGNRLTDENGFPLKNKYGEYMLLLDKNGMALSDSCGGPIFDSNGKQLLLKDLYHMKKCPSFNYLYDRHMPPEHPYRDTSTGNQNLNDSSDDVIPLLDLNFEIEQSSEPVMNYIKENSIRAYDMDVKQINFLQNRSRQTNRKPKWTNFLKNVSIPPKEEYYLQSPMSSYERNMSCYDTRSNHEETEFGNLYQSVHDSNVPYTYEQSIYEESLCSEDDPLFNTEQYESYGYHDQGVPENYEIYEDAEIQYYVDDNNYAVYY